MKYFRFGKVPESGRSLNWFRLSFREQEDVGYDLKMGDSLEEALWKAGVDESRDGLLEDGVSVFELDSDGMPKIQNLQQLVSMVSRIGQTAYIMDGVKVGTGTDAEPLIKDIENIMEATVSAADLASKVESVLVENYEKVESNAFSYSDRLYVEDGGYKDFAGNPVKHSVTYRGKVYFQPKNGWCHKIGYYAFR